MTKEDTESILDNNYHIGLSLFGLESYANDALGLKTTEFGYAFPIGYNGDKPKSRLESITLRLKSTDPNTVYKHMVSLYGEPTEIWESTNEHGETLTIRNTLIDYCEKVYFWKPAEGLSTYDEKVQCMTLAAYRWYYGRYEGTTNLKDITEMGSLMPEDIPVIQARYSESYDGYIALAIRSDKDITTDPHVVVSYYVGPKVLVDLGEKYLSYFDE